MGPVFLLCEICVRAEKACVWAMTNQLQCTAEMRHSKKPPLQEEQGLRVGGEVGLTKGVAVNYLRETQTSELIGLLGFKLISNAKELLTAFLSRVPLKLPTLIKKVKRLFWNHLICNSTQDSGCNLFSLVGIILWITRADIKGSFCYCLCSE